MSTFVVKKEYLLNAVLPNFGIVDSCINFVPITVFRSILHQVVTPKINNGLRASRELVLFE